MNRPYSTIFLTACAVIALGIGNICFAAPSTASSNMAVSATVSSDCTIAAAALAFGSYDPVAANSSSGSDLLSTTNLSVTCTSGASATITLGQGTDPASGSTDASPLRQMQGSGGVLAYNLYQDEGFTTTWGNTSSTGEPYTGTGTATNVQVFGDVPRGQAVAAGAYNDTVVATITF